MSDPNPNRTVSGCLQLARSGGQYPCQCAIDADLLIARLTTVVEAAIAARTIDYLGLLSVEKGWALDKAIAEWEGKS